jgi:carotenoid cleavage oxygenase
MNPPLPIDGVLPPDLQGTLIRVGPGGPGGPAAGGLPGALHGIELRDGAALGLITTPSSADANVFWHAGKVLALAESGLPQRFSRALEPEEFDGGLTVPIASHVHRDAATGGRVLFGLENATETAAPYLRIGEWDASGALIRRMEVQLERATWQHDLGVTARHIVFIESPTELSEALLVGPDGDHGEAQVLHPAVPFRWAPGSPCWVGVVDREGDGSDVRWLRADPCLVTHVLHAHDDGDAVVLYVCRYEVPEEGQPIDLGVSVLGPSGIGMSLIGRGLPVLERWRIDGERLQRTQIDDRMVEYPTSDPACEGGPFRYGYGVEVAPNTDTGLDQEVDHLGLLRFDVARDEVAAWSPGQYRTASEPLFVRAVDGRADDEGWLLSVVHDATRDASDIYVLDASSFGRSPQAVIHLPSLLPFRSHGTWVGADRYR